MSVSAVRAAPARSRGRAVEAWMDDAGNLVIGAAALGHASRSGASVEFTPPHALDSQSPPAVRRGLIALAGVAVLLVALIAIFATHGRQWPWTGFAGSTSLWSWLRMLAQPVALAFLTVRLVVGAPVRVGRWTATLAGVALAFLIFAGYVEHWSWTGFEGKQLWDWLSLMLFPVVVVVLPEWIRRGEPFSARARVIAALALGGFAILVLGGYLWGWTWTGFTGNTFRDWLSLMIAPFLLPVSLRVLHTMQILHGLRHPPRPAAGPDGVVVQISARR